MLGYKALAKLNRKKYRQQYSCYLVEGKKTVLEAIEANVDIIQLVVTPSFKNDQPDYIQNKSIQTFFKKNAVLELGHSQFADIADTTSPQGIAAVVKLPEQSLESVLGVTSHTETKSESNSARTIAILEDIRDPGNVGTIIRTADWFGLNGLICLGGADPYQPKVVRSSMGSIFRIPIFHVGRAEVTEMLEEIISDTKNADYRVIVTRPELNTLKTKTQETKEMSSQILQAEKTCIVFGNEAHGTSSKIDTLATHSMSIPKYGKAESLNVAISFGIILAQRMSEI